jgi:nucleoid-associated protein YgaU
LRWTEIFELNKELVKNDPKRLRPGMVIRLP